MHFKVFLDLLILIPRERKNIVTHFEAFFIEDLSSCNVATCLVPKAEAEAEQYFELVVNVIYLKKHIDKPSSMYLTFF